MEIKLTVRAEIIATLKLFAADNDVRDYLNGINLEIGTTEARLVATDGSCLGCFRIECEQQNISRPLTNIIIPNELLKTIKPKGLVQITIGDLETKDNGKGEQVPVGYTRPLTLTYAGLSISGETINGVFPDWRRVIPSKVSGEPAQFNPAYIGTLAKAYTALHGKKTPFVGIGFNGKDAALIDLGDENFIGILMPLRPEASTAPQIPPSWLTDSLRIATDSAANLV